MSTAKLKFMHEILGAIKLNGRHEQNDDDDDDDDAVYILTTRYRTSPWFALLTGKSRSVLFSICFHL